MAEERKQLGGKGNGLVWLAQHTDLGYTVPEFDVIDTSFYEESLARNIGLNAVNAVVYAKGGERRYNTSLFSTERLEARCDKLHKKFKGKHVAVRSSGVVAEDNDKFSGAGIYDTFFLNDDFTAIDLRNTVLKVYNSVNNPRAVQYRQQNGLGEERMAVVIQERAEGFNGVAMSRLPARAGIIPVSWSSVTGAVVRGDKDAHIDTIHFAKEKEPDSRCLEIIFKTEDINYKSLNFVYGKLTPVIEELKSAYGKEFEIEFSFDPWQKEIELSLLQIRPLTNIQNKTVTFPNKEPIFTAELCAGIGEYIGPWIIPNNLSGDFSEPHHYAYIAPRLEQTVQKSVTSLFLRDKNFARDYDASTPNKRAIILTHQAVPGMHAIMIANEKGILCLARNNKGRSNEEFMLQYGMDRFDLQLRLGGSTLLDLPKFDIPLDKVGKYIHVVSDGLEGRVYQATREEAVAFAQKKGLPIPK